MITIRRKAAAGLVSFGLVAGALVVEAAPAGAATITVRSGHSIQAAIDAAPPGSTIKVNPGTFHENLTINKDGIKLRGTPGETILRPPAEPTGPCTFVGPEGGDPEVEGICVLGHIDFETFTVVTPVTGVRVSGFTVRNFPNQGIFVVGGQGTTVRNNVLEGNGGYGVFAVESTATIISDNVASGSGEAGIYVGDSPEANAVVRNNEAFNNGFGFFIRSASSGAVVSNNAHDNCIGMLFLNAPDSPTNWVATKNDVNHNNEVCEAGEEAPPASGGGIMVFGGHGIVLAANTVNDNAPAGPSFVSGGIALFDGSSGNTVVGNTAHGNDPADLLDQSAASNLFVANDCDTSIPPGLCGATVTTDPTTTTPPPGP